MYMYKVSGDIFSCGITILAENRKGDIGIQTKLQNYNSEMDYLKLLLLDF